MLSALVKSNVDWLQQLQLQQQLQLLLPTYLPTYLPTLPYPTPTLPYPTYLLLIFPIFPNCLFRWPFFLFVMNITMNVCWRCLFGWIPSLVEFLGAEDPHVCSLKARHLCNVVLPKFTSWRNFTQSTSINWQTSPPSISGWWFGTFGLFSPTRLGMMIQSDELHHFFQRGRLKPPTRYLYQVIREVQPPVTASCRCRSRTRRWGTTWIVGCGSLPITGRALTDFSGWTNKRVMWVTQCHFYHPFGKGNHTTWKMDYSCLSLITHINPGYP